MSCKTYFANTLPARESASGSARRVVIKAMRADVGTLGQLASVWRLPPVGCQRSIEGRPAGGGAGTSERDEALGSTGGSTGGGRTAAAVECLPSCRREISVNVWSVLLLASEEYSQQGSTLWPEGACSN